MHVSRRFGMIFGGVAKVSALAATLALVGCGGDGDDGSSNYVGQWQYTSGTTTFTCPGAAPVTEMLSGTVAINAGTDAPLVSVDDGCATKMDFKGNVATIRPGQSCTQVMGNTTVTMAFQAGTFSINSTTGTLSANGTATVSAGGQSVMCTFSMMGGLNKIGK